MEDIEILKLELKGVRAKNAALEAEIKTLRRFRRLIERSAEIAKTIPSAQALVQS